MQRDPARDESPTRRAYLRSGVAIVASGWLAGCITETGPGSGDGSGSGGSDWGRSGDTDPTADGSGAMSDGSNGGETGDNTSEADGSTGTDGNDSVDGSYTVSMAPVGEVEFDRVPETCVANNGSWADMGIALGLEPPEGVWLANRYHTQYYDAVPGVSVDGSDVRSLYQKGGVSKELFYELDADVHVMDPNFLINRFEWERDEVTEVEETVAPLFGNCIYARHYPWHTDYRYYTLYEAFETLARVFQRTDRYEAFEAIHDDFRSNLAPVVPEQGSRPEVAVLWGVGDEPVEFYPYVIGEGTGFKHLDDLGVRDALASTDIRDFHGSRAAIDLETVLEVDPEVLMLRGYEAKTGSEFRNTVVSFLRNHTTASALTAVESGDVYRAGGLYQGPITNMVLTERTARQLYGVDEELFDRGRVAEVVAGEL